MTKTQDKIWNPELGKIEEDILSLIKNGKSFLVLGHQSVDGDAYGSSMGLYFFLQDLGKKVQVINSLPITPLFHFLDIHNNVKDTLDTTEFDAIFICDCWDIRLVGPLLETYKDIFDTTPIVNIDHHNGNKMFGNYNLVDTESSSTCELVYGLIKDLSHISPLVSTCLLFGIIRDTNCFKNSIRPNTFRTTWELVSLHGDYDTIIFHTYRNEKMNYLQLYGYVQENIISLADGKRVGIYISQEIFKKYNIRESELGPQLINEVLSSVEGSEFAFLIKETEKWEYKISTRARLDGLDVSRIAAHFWGGGHIKSAGAYTKEPLDTILQVMEEMDVRI